jgi:hypothetical protein
MWFGWERTRQAILRAAQSTIISSKRQTLSLGGSISRKVDIVRTGPGLASFNAANAAFKSAKKLSEWIPGTRR